MNDRDGRELRSRQRVVYVGMRGNQYIPCRVSRVLKDCVRIRHDDGRVEDVHPEHLCSARAVSVESDRISSLVPNACDFWDGSAQMGREL